jgi:hypothetical protein
MTCPVRLDRHDEGPIVKTVDEWLVELEKWLASRTDNEALAIALASPGARHCIREILGCRESSAIWTGPHEVCVAELADSTRAILFTSAPQIATRETTKDRRASRVRSLALKSVEDFLDCVRQCASLAAAVPADA